MKAYYYCKNFTFKEVNNLFAYNIKDPSFLSKNQKITRLYKGVLKKLLSTHFYVVKEPTYDLMLEEQRRAREDFEKIWNSTDDKEVNAMLEKYELFIEKNFEPDFPLHESRPHSNLHGKLLLYNDEQLGTDHIGYYSKERLVTGEPTGAGFYEEYPHMTGSWVYNSMYENESFDYSEPEANKTLIDRETAKAQLDDLHK